LDGSDAEFVINNGRVEAREMTTNTLLFTNGNKKNKKVYK